MNTYLALDLGGTKLMIAEVSEKERSCAVNNIKAAIGISRRV